MNRQKIFVLPLIGLLFFTLACNLASAPESGTTAIPAPTEAIAQATTAPALPASGACDNPYLPVVEGATWSYNLAGPIPDTYVHSILSVEADGFTEQDVFGTGVTRQGKWKCEQGNLIALTPSGGGSANVETEGVTVDFQTTSLEGVTLPASINPGNMWTQSLLLEGTQTINGETFPASNQTTQVCTAVGLESVTVPAGTFDAMRVDCQITMILSLGMSDPPTQMTLDLSNSNWYATNIGLVKTVSTGEGLDSVIELVSYSIP